MSSLSRSVADVITHKISQWLGQNSIWGKGKGIRFNRQQEKKKPADGLNVS